MLTDGDFEDRLIDRIDARRAIATQLTERQRRLLCRYVRYGETYREIARREGRSAVRISMILNRSIAKLRGYLYCPPIRRVVKSAPAGFDRAAFLRHMRGLIEHRQWKERTLFARERDVLIRMIATEQGKQTQSSVLMLPFAAPVVPKSPPPTEAEMLKIANAVLYVFLFARKNRGAGIAWIGTQCDCVTFLPREGFIAAANRLAVQVPVSAKLSAVPLEASGVMLSVAAIQPRAALRLTLDGTESLLFAEVTWDK